MELELNVEAIDLNGFDDAFSMLKNAADFIFKELQNEFQLVHE